MRRSTAFDLAGFELRRLLGSALGWTLLALGTLVMGWDFLARVDGWMILQESESLSGRTVTDGILMPLAAQTAQLLVVASALLGLHSLGEDRYRGTDALLLSSPASSLSLVTGKWLGLLMLPAMLPLLLMLMAASLTPATDLDWGRLASATLGLCLLAGCCTAIALLVSGWARQPVLGALLSLGVLGLLWLADLGPRSRGIMDSPLELFSLGAQMRGFLAGAPDTGAISWLLSVTLAALSLAAATLRPAGRLRRVMAVAGTMLVAILLIAVGQGSTERLDWTAGQRNSLSPASRALLEGLDEPIEVTVYASRDRQVRVAIQRFMSAWQAAAPGFQVIYIDPAEDPQLVRKRNLQFDGEVDISYAGRIERLRQLSESDLANALQRLSRSKQHLVAYTWGSGERDLRGQTPFDLGRFGEALATRGVDSRPLDLLVNPVIPDNLDLLIITQPRQPLLPSIVVSLRQYLEDGGNALWLADPGSLTGLESLADSLGIAPLPGIVLDARTAQFGVENPRLPVVIDYPDHATTRDFRMPTVYPQAVAWEILERSDDLRVDPIIQTHKSTWTETGPVEGQVGFNADAGERSGPLTLGVALQHPDSGQRVVVVGDADFLSNAYLGNAGNLDLGLRLVNWLLADDDLIQVPARVETDVRLALAPRTLGWIGLFWLIGVPGLFGFTALIITWRRRRA